MNKIQKADLDICLVDEKLEVKEFAKYFVIYINSKLTWEKHMQITYSKLQKRTGIIKTMQHFLHKKQLKLLF